MEIRALLIAFLHMKMRASCSAKCSPNCNSGKCSTLVNYTDTSRGMSKGRISFGLFCHMEALIHLLLVVRHL